MASDLADQAGVPQAAWQLVRAGELENHMENTLDLLENRFRYPMFVKPAGTGSSVGVSKVGDRDALRSGLRYAGKYDKKILVEEFVNGKEIEVAVMGNDNPMVSVCGEIDSGLAHQGQVCGQPLKNTVVRMPGPSCNEKL